MDIVQDVIYDISKLVFFKLMLGSILVLRLILLERDVDEGEESEVHLWVTFEVASLIPYQLI